MKKIFLFASAFVFFYNTLNAQQLWRSEILGRPTNSGITVQILFADSAQIRVQYGTSSGTYTNQTNWQTFADSATAEIVLTGLQPNTQYFYKVNYRQPGATSFNSRPEHSFHTQRPTTDSFVFIVQADPHMDASSDTALYRVCLQNQLKDKPDFMIDLGDFLMTDKLKNTANQVPFDTIPYRCNLLRSKYEISCHSVPLFIALGNHEGEEGWYNNGTSNNIAVWDAQQRKRFFPNPFPNSFYTGDTSNTPFVGARESFYAWQWGNALFVVIDPYWYTSPKPDSLTGWRWTLGKMQYDWLKQTLENSNAKFKYIFAHQIVGGDREGRGGVEYADKYEWGGSNLDGTPGWATNRSGWYKPLKDLFAENRVNIFFHGHDHFYGQQKKDCMIYQETPQPSLPNFNYPNSAAPYGYLQGLILGNTGHLRVSVTPNYTKVEYVKAYRPSQETATRHNGDVVATYFINAVNCYDSLNTGSPMIWNSNYADEVVYPNPFQQQTKIEFTLKNSDAVTLDIIAINGKLVRRLMDNETLNSGKFQMMWDGKNFNQTYVNNGTYWYILKNKSGENKSGKIVLMR